MESEKVKFGKYRHYKGNLYEVVNLAKFAENSDRELEDLVIYKALYKSTDFPDGMLWVRTVKEFIEKVDVDGKLIDRFEYLG